ncbi:hypothetical protein ACTHPB_28860 [Priestia megaterium]|uniref:hypothetical protein n=1 Tax=Priestia megaterium TaxID=1404 RepID=UPI003F814D19
MSMVGGPGGIKESTMSLYEDPLGTQTIVFECQPAREPLHFRSPQPFYSIIILDHAAVASVSAFPHETDRLVTEPAVSNGDYLCV